MRYIIFFLGFFLCYIGVEAQDKELSIYDYGFQLDDVIPLAVPYGYTSIYSARLNDSLHAGKTYKVTILVTSSIPKGHDRFAYDFWLFESTMTGRNSMNRESVKSEDIFPRIQHDGRYRNLNNKSFIKFIVTPTETSTHLSVGVKDDNSYKINNIQKYITVQSMHVLSLQTIESKVDLVNSETLVDSITKLQVDRKMIFSGEKFVVSEETVSIFVYDHRRVDGDIITLYLNDTLILERSLLQRKKKELKIKLKPGENKLLLYAENLGEVPPNTAAIQVITKTHKFEKILTADLKQSEYLTIFYQPNTKD